MANYLVQIYILFFGWVTIENQDCDNIPFRFLDIRDIKRFPNTILKIKSFKVLLYKAFLNYGLSY